MIYNKNKLYTLNKKIYGVSVPSGGGGGGGTEYGLLGDGTRNKFLWPFASTSIWNTPIGTGATFTSIGSILGYYFGYYTRFTPEEEYIFMDTTAPSTVVNYNPVGWDAGDRCVASGSAANFPFNVPMQSSFTVPDNDFNNCAAWIDSTGNTVIQAQPFTRCTAGSYATCKVKFGNENIYSDGRLGSHGGSELSALGGTVRCGELTDAYINNRSYLRHALKITMSAELWYYWGGGGGNEYRWPATKADGYASSSTYAGSNSQLKPGALITLNGFDPQTLRTWEGRLFGETIKRFGMYAVDDSAYNAIAIALEYGPNGRVKDEFNSLFLHPFDLYPNSIGEKTSWYLDWEDIMSHAYVVNNNASGAIGGGGSPKYGTPTAPSIGN